MKKKYETPSISICKMEVDTPVAALTISGNMNWTATNNQDGYKDFTWEDVE